VILLIPAASLYSETRYEDLGSTPISFPPSAIEVIGREPLQRAAAPSHHPCAQSPAATGSLRRSALCIANAPPSRSQVQISKRFLTVKSGGSSSPPSVRSQSPSRLPIPHSAPFSALTFPGCQKSASWQPFTSANIVPISQSDQHAIHELASPLFILAPRGDKMGQQFEISFGDPKTETSNSRRAGPCLSVPVPEWNCSSAARSGTFQMNRHEAPCHHGFCRRSDSQRRIASRRHVELCSCEFSAA
jgi:hypothetical protein